MKIIKRLLVSENEFEQYKGIYRISTTVLASDSLDKKCGLNSVQIEIFPSRCTSIPKHTLDIFNELIYYVNEDDRDKAKLKALEVIQLIEPTLNKLQELFPCNTSQITK